MHLNYFNSGIDFELYYSYQFAFYHLLKQDPFHYCFMYLFHLIFIIAINHFKRIHADLYIIIVNYLY